MLYILLVFFHSLNPVLAAKSNWQWVRIFALLRDLVENQAKSDPPIRVYPVLSLTEASGVKMESVNGDVPSLKSTDSNRSQSAKVSFICNQNSRQHFFLILSK